jgi:hypothetical protein
VILRNLFPAFALRAAAWLACGCAALAPAARAQGPAPDFRIDRDRRDFADIRDGTPIQSDPSNGEYRAYNSVLLHARGIPTADLERFARRDVSFRDLFLNTDEHRFDLVHFEGRLKQLRRTDPTLELKEAGVSDLFEGWLFPHGETNPVCILATELPPGLEAQTDLHSEMDRRVGFAGFFFKKFRYESRKPNPKDPNRYQDRLAPLLMGHSITPLDESAVVPRDNPWVTVFLPAALAGILGLGLLMVVLRWYFRRGDRVIDEAHDARRKKNPFTE